MRRLRISGVLLGICWLCVTAVSAQTDTSAGIDEVSVNDVPEVTMKARPVSCVTLREGQPCFIKLSITWESTSPISACLISEQHRARECWVNASSGMFTANLYLSESTIWQLENSLGSSYGSVRVSVAWVYDSRRVRRNWRLF